MRRFNGWIVGYVNVDAAWPDDAVERVNITLPRRVLMRLDAKAKEAGETRRLHRPHGSRLTVKRSHRRDYMRDFVRQQEDAAAHDAWFRRQVQIGLDSANAEDVIPAAEVEAEAEAWRAETRRKMTNDATS